VVSVEYSLAPESLYPTPVKEGLEVLDWLNHFGAKEGLDNSNVFLAGDSAGGNIVLNMATDPTLHSTLKGLVLIYPSLDPTLSTKSMQQFATGHFLTKSMLVEFWGLYEGDKGLYQLPTDTALKDLPPTLLIAAEKDVLRDEGFDFAEKLRSFNKDVEYECYSDMLHGFMQFPKIASKKVQAFGRIAAFISKHSSSS
jgi:acetyl esterase